MKVRTPDRVCGSCRLCCRLVSIQEKGEVDGEPYEFVKPAGEWCNHTCEAGCAVWTEGPPVRAEACARFRCLWLEGYLLERHKPEHSKVVAVLEEQYLDGGAGRPGDVQDASRDVVAYWVLWESWPGVSEKGLGRDVRDFLRKTDYDVVVMHKKHGDRTVWKPGAAEGVVVPFTGDREGPGA